MKASRAGLTTCEFTTVILAELTLAVGRKVEILLCLIAVVDIGVGLIFRGLLCELERVRDWHQRLFRIAGDGSLDFDLKRLYLILENGAAHLNI